MIDIGLLVTGLATFLTSSEEVRYIFINDASVALVATPASDQDI